MAKKDEAKMMAGEPANVSKPGKSVKTEAAKMQKKPAAQKKPVQVRGKHETTFRLVAPHAAQVFIAGCFNEWDPTANRLEQDEEGTWSCTLSIEPGEHEYRFVVDGVWWDDPANMSRRSNEFGTENCVLIVQD
jgi:1,4-alpha-glucan branching enzyme